MLKSNHEMEPCMSDQFHLDYLLDSRQCIYFPAKTIDPTELNCPFLQKFILIFLFS